MAARILIHVVAYNAQATLTAVLDRITWSATGDGPEVLVIDDASTDDTFEVGVRYEVARSGLPVTVLRTPTNQGYGGNQKLGYRYAIDRGYDVVALLHGDGQYPPELIPDLVEPIVAGNADAVFGSRMMNRGDARKGGMPLYKYVGNRVLSEFQNRILGTRLTEFHSGFRAYSVDALRKIPFERNTDDFHFDTEIILQFLKAGLTIREIPIPTYYGDEICHVNGLRYAQDVAKATLLSRAQSLGIYFDRKFDTGAPAYRYTLKADFESSHRMAIDAVRTEDRVLDIGCGDGRFAAQLRQEKRSTVVGVDHPNTGAPFDGFVAHDLNEPELPEAVGTDFDVVLMLDVIEHLRSPERFLDALRNRLGKRRPRLILTTPNIAFLPMRMSLAAGRFNYGPRGILDLTHTRLFTFASLRALLEQSGYEILEMTGVPAPFPLALGDTAAAHGLLRLNRWANAIRPSLFAYQIYVEARIKPTVAALLDRSVEESQIDPRRLEIRGVA